MARPVKRTVDYFPHDTHAATSKTMYILDSEYGNDGYAFWFKLLELLGSSAGHVYDCRNAAEWGFLVAKTRVTADIAESILDTLAQLDAIDPELWKHRVIWSQNFVTRLTDVYAKRKQDLPSKPNLNRKHSLNEVSGPETLPVLEFGGQSGSETPQTKVKETKVQVVAVPKVVSTTEIGTGEPDSDEAASVETDQKTSSDLEAQEVTAEPLGPRQVLAHVAKRLRILPTQISAKDLNDLREDCARHGPQVVMRAVDLGFDTQMQKCKYKRGDPRLGPDIRSYQFFREFLNEARELMDKAMSADRDREIGTRRRAETRALIDELMAAGGR